VSNTPAAPRSVASATCLAIGRHQLPISRIRPRLPAAATDATGLGRRQRSEKRAVGTPANLPTGDPVAMRGAPATAS